jgi:molecular chaperone IbpA
MNTFDLSPRWQSTVGFDRLTDLMEDSVRRMGGDNYPPYNIERAGEDHYQISLALAGFAPDEVTFIAEPNVLTIEGRKVEKGEHQYVYQGISSRPFRPAFNPAAYVQVKAASFEKKTETEDRSRRFSERYYGRFERRIPVEDVDEDKISASFKDGVLTVTMPKLPQAESKVKRIAINSK